MEPWLVEAFEPAMNEEDPDVVMKDGGAAEEEDGGFGDDDFGDDGFGDDDGFDDDGDDDWGEATEEDPLVSATYSPSPLHSPNVLFYSNS